MVDIDSFTDMSKGKKCIINLNEIMSYEEVNKRIWN